MTRRKLVQASMRRLVILGTAVLLLVGAAAHGAHARSDGYTRGDAEALLNTYPTTARIGDRYWSGGQERMLDIRPFPLYQDFHYCVEDWHLVAFADWWGEFVSSSVSYTRAQAWDVLDTMTVEMFLDGVPVRDLARTPIGVIPREDTRASFEAQVELFLGEDVTVTKMWGRQWGRIMAPRELPVGQHSLDATITLFPGTPSEFRFQTGTMFEVSGSDSAACTG